MSIHPVHVNVRNTSNNEYSNAEVSNGVAFIGVKTNLKDNTDNQAREKANDLNVNKWIFIKLAYLHRVFVSRNPPTFNEQVELFHSSMKYFIISGQCLGVFPMIDYTNSNPPKRRYPILSWRYAISFIMCFGQLLLSLVSFYRLLNSSINNHAILHFSVFFLNYLTCILFIRLATKWHYLVKQVTVSELNEYIDPNVIYKCKISVVGIIGLTILENTFSLASKAAVIRDCYSDSDNKFRMFIKIYFPWFFELKLEYSHVAGICLLIYRTPSAIIWSFSHIFIICVSFYLTSILEQINKKILSCEGKYMPASYWRALREDYNRATRLVRTFDDVINSIVFLSFASNLFFVCLKIFHVISKVRLVEHQICYNEPSRILSGYEYGIYHIYSLGFVILRSFLVLIIGARVHSASLIAAPSLYNVPSPSYCTEVQRFIEQLHGDTVALTGLNFFYVTRELVLSVVGTIVTYELVLFQFNED